MTQAQILTLLIAALPDPERIKDINLSYTHSVQFSYLGETYRVGMTLTVDVVSTGGSLTNNNASAFLSKLLKSKNTISENG